MKILALDTATEACSVALFTDDGIYERHEIAPRRHTRLILPMIDDVLTEAGHRLNDLDAIAFGQGPGAFTGIRLAAGVTQGLALGAGLPVIPLSSLATLAQGAIDKSVTLMAAIDARMGEIYWALYEPTGDGTVQLAAAEQVAPPDAVKVPADTRFFGVGSGWRTYREHLEKAFNEQIIGSDPERYPLAKDMLPLVLRELKNNQCVSADQALPVYLRDNVVK